MIIPLILATLDCVVMGSQIVCSGTGEGYVTYVTPAGTCTNCVKMTSEYCNNFKSSYSTYVEQLNGQISLEQANLNRAKVSRDEFSTITNYTSLIRQQSGVPSLAKVRLAYIDEHVSTLIQQLDDYEHQVSDSLYQIQTYIPTLREFPALIDCSECDTSDPQKLTIPISVSGNVITNTITIVDPEGQPGSSTSTHCLCTEQYNGLKNLLSEISYTLSAIDSRISQISEVQNDIKDILDDFASNVDSLLNSLDETVSRIDDYLSGDQKNILEYILTNVVVCSVALQDIDVKNIERALFVISNDVDNVQKKWFQRNAAATGLNLDGQPLQNVQISSNVLASVFGNGFDESTYQQYNWFARVELLLAQIAGLGSSEIKNTISDSSLNDIKNASDTLSESFVPSTSLQSNVHSLSSSLTSFSSSLVNFWPNSSPNTSGVQFLPSNTLFYPDGLSVHVPIDVQNYCHYSTTLIISVIALVVAVRMSVFAFSVTFKLLSWYFDTLIKMFS